MAEFSSTTGVLSEPINDIPAISKEVPVTAEVSWNFDDAINIEWIDEKRGKISQDLILTHDERYELSRDMGRYITQDNQEELARNISSGWSNQRKVKLARDLLDSVLVQQCGTETG